MGLSLTFFSSCRQALGLPYSLMVAKLGSDEALGKALRRGDVVEVKDKGRTYYAWQEISVTRSTGTKEQFSVSRGSAALNDTELEQMDNFFSSWQPRLGADVFEDSSLMASVGASGSVTADSGARGRCKSAGCVCRFTQISISYVCLCVE